MNILEEKQRLVTKINQITNPTIIDKINSILNDSYENSFLTDSQISIVRERQEEYLSSPKEVINLSEFKASIKEKYGF
jgi:hypothetical protein